MTLRYLSLFSGIEAASVAWDGLDLEPVAFAELDPFPSAVLAARFPHVPNLGDVTRVDWAAWRGRADLVIGGPPCQDFSVAGNRAGAQGARGNLSLIYARAIHAIRPLWAITENVPGWLSMPDNAFGAFLGELAGADAPLRSPLERGRWPDAGMVAGPRARIAWRILDAQHFGLAQRRRRVFIVAGLGDGTDPAAVLFEPKSMRGNPAAGREAREDAAGAAADGARGGGEVSYTLRQPSNGAAWRGDGADNLVAGTIGTGGRHATGLKNEADVMIAHTIRAPQVATTVRARDGAKGVDSDATDTLVIANTVQASAGHHGYGSPLNAERPHGVLAFGGNNTSGPIDVASACNGHGGPKGRQDFETETFVVGPLTASAGPNAHGGSGLATNGGAEAGHLVPVGFVPDADPICANEQRTYTHEGEHNFRTRNVVAFVQNQREEVREMAIAGSLKAERGMHEQTFVAFDTTQITSAENRSNPQPGDPCHPLAAQGHPPAVAFSCKDSGQDAADEISPTLRAMNEGGGNANGGGQVAVALCEGAHGVTEPDLAPALQGVGGKAGQGYAAARTASGVRRLTPRECERLQGFPDDHTLIPYRGKAAPDGPRYKSIGNSMATPCIRWIGERILAQGGGR